MIINPDEGSGSTGPDQGSGNTTLIDAYMRVVLEYWDKIKIHEDHMENEDLQRIDWDIYYPRTPLFIGLIDLTGDGEEELLFMAASDEDTGWPGTIADLYVYTRVGNDAERILFVPSVYVLAGDGDWYRIMREPGSTRLFLEYGCYVPGTAEKYVLGEDGHYMLTNRITAGAPDFDNEEDMWDYQINGLSVSEGTYQAALKEMIPENAEVLFSTDDLTSYTSIRVWEFEGVLKNMYLND